jgi:hypothetical protein
VTVKCTKMRIVRGPAAVCLLMAINAPALFGQTLNPTVKVLPKPTSIVPTDCDAGLAPAAPRQMAMALPAETPTPAIRDVVPPAADLRTRLRRVQSAAESGDYQTFKTTLAEARTALASYPAGGEKQAAGDVMQVFTDLERLWDFAMTAPTGAFFDDSSENGAITSALRKYPEFPRVVADATMTVSGTTIYPSNETRRFLANEAAKRLTRLGVRTPARVVEERPKPRVQPQPQPQPKPQPRVVQHQPKAQPQPKPAKKPVTKIAEAKPKPQPQPKVAQPVPVPAPQPKVVAPAPQPQPQPKVVAPAPQPQPKVIAPAPQPYPAPQPQPKPTGGGQPPPAVPPTATTATTATAMTKTDSGGPLSSTTSTTTSATDTTMTASATDTTSTTATTTAEKPAPGGMNLTFAIILIVIGVGVLIVLFRASD